MHNLGHLFLMSNPIGFRRPTYDVFHVLKLAVIDGEGCGIGLLFLLLLPLNQYQEILCVVYFSTRRRYLSVILYGINPQGKHGFHFYLNL